MTPAECYPWQNSRNKLWAGDSTMLQRVDTGEDTTTRGFARATPAPCTQTRLREDRPVTEPERTLLDSDSTKFAPGRTDCPPQIKQEVAADSSDMTHETLLRSREQPGISPHIRPAVSSSAGEESHLGSKRCLKAPVMDIPWGSDPFGEVDVDIVVEKIMHTLNSRIKVQYIAVQRLCGSIHTESKKSIEKQLRDLFPHMRRRRSKWNFDNVLSKLEQRLVPWAIACPTSFPELRTYAIYFTRVMVGVTPVTDLIYGTDAELTWEVRGIARDCIEWNLRARGLHVVRYGVRFTWLNMTDSGSLHETRIAVWRDAMYP